MNMFLNYEDQYKYIYDTFENAYQHCNCGFAMNFLSDRVDYRTSDSDFHANPGKILDMTYDFSRNVIFDNNIMPFEFCVTVFKDDSFNVDKTIFNAYIKENGNV